MVCIKSRDESSQTMYMTVVEYELYFSRDWVDSVDSSPARVVGL
jgi:hypothetical protein